MSEPLRIVFPLDPKAWHRCARETIWAEPLGNGRARLLNVPCLAAGVSRLDVVFVDHSSGHPTFAGVSIHSGHSTFQLRLGEDASREVLQAYWEPLETLGCRYEVANPRLWGVDVPPEIDARKVRKALRLGEDAGVWDVTEGYFAPSAGL